MVAAFEICIYFGLILLVYQNCCTFRWVVVIFQGTILHVHVKLPISKEMQQLMQQALMLPGYHIVSKIEPLLQSMNVKDHDLSWASCSQWDGRQQHGQGLQGKSINTRNVSYKTKLAEP